VNESLLPNLVPPRPSANEGGGSLGKVCLSTLLLEPPKNLGGAGKGRGHGNGGAGGQYTKRCEREKKGVSRAFPIPPCCKCVMKGIDALSRMVVGLGTLFVAGLWARTAWWGVH
jgi:hypothetical protein